MCLTLLQQQNDILREIHDVLGEQHSCLVSINHLLNDRAKTKTKDEIGSAEEDRLREEIRLFKIIIGIRRERNEEIRKENARLSDLIDGDTRVKKKAGDEGKEVVLVFGNRTSTDDEVEAGKHP